MFTWKMESKLASGQTIHKSMQRHTRVSAEILEKEGNMIDNQKEISTETGEIK